MARRAKFLRIFSSPYQKFYFSDNKTCKDDFRQPPPFKLSNNCLFAKIKMTFSNFGQKAGFYRQTCSKLLKAVAFFVEFL